tara:strand:- start:633 stop:1295 length:663 start_codon:yes stop_codon:yes gene_type:complete
MVLRDVRDKMTAKRILCREKTRADAKWKRRKSKIHRRKSRKNTKKNIDKPVVFTGKKEMVVQEENKVEKSKEVCSICCEEKRNIKYINCKRGGIQNVNFGRYGQCCKDKAICHDCMSKCSNKCPFCKGHSLRSLKNKFPQKKPSFALRQKRIRLKKDAKKMRKPKLRVSVRRSQGLGFRRFSSEMNRRLRHENTYAPTVYIMDRTPLIIRQTRNIGYTYY